MRFFDWLKSLFTTIDTPPHEYLPSTLTFAELDLNALIRNLQLKEDGAQRGKDNQPNGVQTGFDSVEARIATTIQSELSIAHERFARHMRAYGERQATLQVHGKFAQLETQAAATRADFAAHVGTGKDLIWKLARDVERRNKELDAFRSENKLRREPQMPESKLLYWGVISILVLIESLLNGQLLARGVELGILGGITQALIIAILNVGFGYTAGRYLFTNVNHAHTRRKIGGYASIILWMFIAFAFNLLVAHYRAALGGTNPSEAEKVAISTFTSAPFSISEISGWLLFFLGCSFSLIAAVDGWNMDDPYPGYGHLAQRFDLSLEDYTSQKQELLWGLEEIKNSAIKKIDDLILEVDKGATQYRNIKANETRLIEQFNTYVQYLQRCGNELLSVYQQANVAARSTPAPEHFSAEWKIASPPDITDADPGAASIDQRISSTFEGIRAARRQVLEDYAAALQEFKSVESLVTKGTTADATLSASQT
jgi:hypothetical protein